MRFEIKNIEPMGAVRMTVRGKFVKANAQRYLTYKQLIYHAILKQLDGVYEPMDCAINAMVWFKMPIPASWSKKKKEEAIGQFCTTKPDIDNLVKGLFDSLNGLLWIDDNRIAVMNVYKIYSNEPGIDLEIEPIGELSHGQATRGQKEKSKQAATREKAPRTRRNISKRL